MNTETINREYQDLLGELSDLRAERDALKAEIENMINARPSLKTVNELFHMRKAMEKSDYRFLINSYYEMKAELEAARKQEPIGEVCGTFKGAYSVGNVFFPECGPLPDHTKLYASPVPNPAALPDDARYIIDPRLNDDGEYYIRGKDINAILKGGDNER